MIRQSLRRALALLAMVGLLAIAHQAHAADDIAGAYSVPGNPGLGPVVQQFVLDCASNDGSKTGIPCGTAANPLTVTISGGTITVTGGATAANQVTANTSLGTIAGAQGAPGTGITQPTGGTGVLGWLSGIYKAVTGTMVVTAASVTPAAPSGALTLTAGGTAQVLASAASATHGCLIANPASATRQGLAVAEAAYIDLTGTSATTAAGGTSIELLPGATYPCPAGLTTSISWTAATTGHKISAMVY